MQSEVYLIWHMPAALAHNVWPGFYDGCRSTPYQRPAQHLLGLAQTIIGAVEHTAISSNSFQKRLAYDIWHTYHCLVSKFQAYCTETHHLMRLRLMTPRFKVWAARTLGKVIILVVTLPGTVTS